MQAYRIFFIDYENTGWTGLTGIENLTPSDSVFIFHNGNGGALPFEAITILANCKAHIETRHVTVGTKNALDFQLSSELGFILGSAKREEREQGTYFVISKDNGFSPLAPFWQDRGATILFAPTIAEGLSKEEQAVSNEEESASIAIPEIEGKKEYKWLNRNMLERKSVAMIAEEIKEEKTKHDKSNEQKIENFLKSIPQETKSAFQELDGDEVGKKYFWQVANILVEAYDHKNKQPNDFHSILQQKLGAQIDEKQAKKGKIISRIYKMIRPVLDSVEAKATIETIRAAGGV